MARAAPPLWWRFKKRCNNFSPSRFLVSGQNDDEEILLFCSFLGQKITQEKASSSTDFISGAFVVGGATLDFTFGGLNTTKLKHEPVRQADQRSEPSDVLLETICKVGVSLVCTMQGDVEVQFHVGFLVIEGKLSLLIGLPILQKLAGALRLEYSELSSIIAKALH